MLCAKKSDKERITKEQNFTSVTFDLQSVVQIPCSDVSPMYYSRKICVYNLSIHESNPPNNPFCYCWEERQFGNWSHLYGSGFDAQFHRKGQEICSGIYARLAKIFRIAMSKRNKNKTSGPYNVRQMKFYDFYDLKNLSSILIRNKTKYSNGQIVNWLLTKSYFKYEHSGEYRKINLFNKGRPLALPKLLKMIYSKILPISAKKKKGLLNLCNSSSNKPPVIPEEFHEWYK